MSSSPDHPLPDLVIGLPRWVGGIRPVFPATALLRQRQFHVYNLHSNVWYGISLPEALMLKLAIFCLFLVRNCNSVSKREFQSWWCPNQCYNATSISLCDRNYLFIISTGRSGSTTLLKSLRLVDGINIIGETNILPELESMYHGATAIQLDRGLPLDENLVLEKLQRIFNILLGSGTPTSRREGPSFFGSKEVHVSADVLPFIRRLFPCSRFVFNIRRNVEKQSQSAFHKRAGSSPQELRRQAASLLRAHERLPLVSHAIALEDFGPPAFDNLLRWMGFSGCHYGDIGHYNFNGTYRPVSGGSISGVCAHRFSSNL